MSIDAKVNSVIVGIHGEGYLALIDRSNGGQSRLYFELSPSTVIALNNCNIWGNSESIMLGDKEIATRIGYTRIKFVKDSLFTIALERYKNVS